LFIPEAAAQKRFGGVLIMRKGYLMILPGLALVLTVGCSGPSVTNSDTTGASDQAFSLLKKDITKKDETLAAGTVIRASLQHALTTDSNAPGDPFTAKVVDDVKVNNTVVIPLGSTVKGVVAESRRSGRVKGRAYMSLKFTEVVLPNGQSYPIQASGPSRRKLLRKGRLELLHSMEDRDSTVACGRCIQRGKTTVGVPSTEIDPD
jgi:hypothetical protein